MRPGAHVNEWLAGLARRAGVPLRAHRTGTVSKGRFFPEPAHGLDGRLPELPELRGRVDAAYAVLDGAMTAALAAEHRERSIDELRHQAALQGVDMPDAQQLRTDVEEQPAHLYAARERYAGEVVAVLARMAELAPAWQAAAGDALLDADRREREARAQLERALQDKRGVEAFGGWLTEAVSEGPREPYFRTVERGAWAATQPDPNVVPGHHATIEIGDEARAARERGREEREAQEVAR